MIILKRMLKKEKSGNSWTGLVWSRIGISGGGVGGLGAFCEHGNEMSGSIKCWEFLD
jgi:hypothetical protein